MYSAAAADDDDDVNGDAGWIYIGVGGVVAVS